MQLYSFTFGDNSRDGHEKTQTYYFKCNRNRQQIKELFKKFEQLVGLSFSHNNGLPTIFADYEENFITKSNLDKILQHATNKREIIELFECESIPQETNKESFDAVCKFNGDLTEDEVVPAYNALPQTYVGTYWERYAFDYNLGKVVLFNGHEHELQLELAGWMDFFPYFVFECLKIVDSDLQYEQADNDVPELIYDNIGYGLFH